MLAYARHPHEATHLTRWRLLTKVVYHCFRYRSVDRLLCLLFPVGSTRMNDSRKVPMSDDSHKCRARLTHAARLMIVLLYGCQTSEVAPPSLNVAEPLMVLAADEARFGARPELLDDAQLHYLTNTQKQHFLEWFNHPLRAPDPPQYRLFYYLEELTEDFQYDDRTLPASDTLALRSGNCLSLAILTTALARLVNVDVAYQLMNDEPVFALGGDVVKKGLHVRTVLNLPGAADVDVLRPSRLVIDYFPTGRERFVANIDAAGYRALYHGNMGAQALEQGSLGTAYWQAMAAIELVPTDSAALNLLAVVHRRSGDADTAEAIYRYAIPRADDQLSLLKNYQLLLRQQGRLTEAEAIDRQLDSMEDPSPFRWYQLARIAEDAGDLPAAIRYYGRALDRAPYLHEAYLGQALAYYRSGQSRSAAAALEQAMGAAQTISARKLYKAKLAALEQEL